MLVDERLQLGNQLRVTAERQVGLEAALERDEAQLLEAADLRLPEHLGSEIGQRRPAPEQERFPQESRGALGWCAVGRPDESLEAQQVELVRRDSDDVARLACCDHVGVSEQLSEL
jgi:hypothetical protein